MDFFFLIFFTILGLSFGFFLGKSSVEMIHYELYVHAHNCHGDSLNVGIPHIGFFLYQSIFPTERWSVQLIILLRFHTYRLKCSDKKQSSVLL